MSEAKTFVTENLRGLGDAKTLLHRLLDLARPEAVFAEPITVGEQRIIIASEVGAALGFGLGIGAEETRGQALAVGALEGEGQEDLDTDEAPTYGGGGGGGGGAGGRPVAVISITEDDVRVVPIVDRTKIGLAALSAAASFLIMLMRLSRTAKR